MRTKIIAPASIVVVLCFLLFAWYANLTREPAQTRDGGADAFRESLQCTLQKLLPGETNARRERAQLTLDFAYQRLFQKIADYGIDSPREETVHFMAQVLHETNYLQYMVESAEGRTWRDAMDAATPSGWDCGAYRRAIVSDRDYFNTQKSGLLKPGEDPYVKFYRSTYRGRGLIHLTSCHNYLSFFYHKAALRENRPRLARKIHPNFYYLDRQTERLRKIYFRTFCTQNMMERLQDSEGNGFLIEPIYLVTDFEDIIDELSLPCPDIEVPPMKSTEFLVDSAANYWRKCQEGKRYKNYLNQATAESVARISECVHGSAWELYDTFNEDTCAVNGDGIYTGTVKENVRNGIIESRRWIADSYCGRLRNFQALHGCFF